MGVTIRRDQRDAIYAAVTNHLSGIGDVWLAMEQETFAEAKRLGRVFAEDLRLLEDLGWGETTDRDTLAITMPVGELAHAIARLHRDAAGSLGTCVSRPKEDEAVAERDLAGSSALADLLSRLVHLEEHGNPGGEEGSR
jgi:hypothetical protein